MQLFDLILYSSSSSSYRTIVHCAEKGYMHLYVLLWIAPQQHNLNKQNDLLTLYFAFTWLIIIMNKNGYAVIFQFVNNLICTKNAITLLTWILDQLIQSTLYHKHQNWPIYLYVYFIKSKVHQELTHKILLILNNEIH